MIDYFFSSSSHNEDVSGWQNEKYIFFHAKRIKKKERISLPMQWWRSFRKCAKRYATWCSRQIAPRGMQPVVKSYRIYFLVTGQSIKEQNIEGQSIEG
jgi:hypothetical protein